MHRSVALSIGSSLAAVASLLASPAQAQENQAPAATSRPATAPQAPDQAVAPSAAPTSANSSASADIVVTAQRRSERLQEVPLSVTALSPTELNRLNVRDTRDLMQAIPGLQVATQTGGDGAGSAVYFLRGMGQERQGNGAEPAVGVYVDGFYYPTLYGSVFKIVDLAQVEVLRGPQGTLFGRNTIGGAIQYTSAGAELGKFSGHISGTLGNYDRQDITGAVNIPIGDFAAIRVTGGHLEQDGWVRVQSGGPDAGRTRTDLVRVQARVEPTSSIYVDGSVLYSRDRLFGFTYNLPGPITPAPLKPGESPSLPFAYNNVAPLLGLPFYNDAFRSQCFYCQPGSSIPEYSDSTYKNALLTAGWDLGGGLSLKSLTGWQSIDTDLGVDPDGTPAPVYFFQLPVRTRTFSQELQLNGKVFDDRLNFVAGAFYYNERFPAITNTRSNLLFGNPVPAPVEGRTLKSYAGYVDATLQLADKLKVIGGFRYAEDHKGAFAVPPTGGARIDAKTSTFDSSTWRAGLQYQWKPDVMTYATVSTGYRAGGLNRYVSIPQLSFLRFEPEKSTSYEVGARMQFADRRVTINPTAFYVDWKNIQVQNVVIIDASTATVGTVIQNVAAARSYGFELEFAVQPTDNLRLFGNFAYLNIRYKSIGAATGLTTDSELQRSPPITFALGATHTLDLGNAGSVETTLNYSFEDDQQSSPKTSLLLPAYGLLNGRIAFTPTDKRFTISLFATNLTNEKYYIGGVDYTGLVGTKHYDVGRPREVGISGRVNF